MATGRKAITFIWNPFVISVGVASWAILAASLALLATVVLAPAVRQVNAAERQRNNMRATVALLNEKIAVQKRFVRAANTSPLLMERLASRQLNIERPDQQILPLGAAPRDRTVQGLIAQALKPVRPVAVAPMPWWMAAAANSKTRSLLLMLGCVGLLLSYVLDVRVRAKSVPAAA